MMLKNHSPAVRPRGMGYALNCIDKFAVRQRLKNNVPIVRMIDTKLPE